MRKKKSRYAYGIYIQKNPETEDWEIYIDGKKHKYTYSSVTSAYREFEDDENYHIHVLEEGDYIDFEKELDMDVEDISVPATEKQKDFLVVLGLYPWEAEELNKEEAAERISVLTAMQRKQHREECEEVFMQFCKEEPNFFEDETSKYNFFQRLINKKTILQKRTCPNCDKEFWAKTYNHRFCSFNCRDEEKYNRLHSDKI